MTRSLIVENLLLHNVRSIIKYLQYYTEAVDDNQLRTMALETVDPIDWLLPPPSWAVPPELHVLHGVKAAFKSQDLLHQPGMPDKTHYLCGHSGVWPGAI